MRVRTFSQSIISNVILSELNSKTQSNPEIFFLKKTNVVILELGRAAKKHEISGIVGLVGEAVAKLSHAFQKSGKGARVLLWHLGSQANEGECHTKVRPSFGEIKNFREFVFVMRLCWGEPECHTELAPHRLPEFNHQEIGELLCTGH